MEESVEDMQIKLQRGLEEIEVFKKLFLSKATEKAVSKKIFKIYYLFLKIGTYLNNISDCLHKECGEKPFHNKLDQPNMLQEFY